MQECDLRVALILFAKSLSLVGKPDNLLEIQGSWSGVAASEVAKVNLRRKRSIGSPGVLKRAGARRERCRQR